ncbi:hypothetical protein D9619_012015 [Psilocybe cf. subviscida]|uniref:ribonuclease H n=1 Tax=Psilocybe cf. subviscida TaxID=2480587 RepID=A0A8H5EZQ7_9AGAR|nr:hypothetical protein D9619_012015 [Psilocybe cf. subviscida]
MRRFWTGVAMPRILYAADVFLTPQIRRKTDPEAQCSGRAVIKKLTSIQRRAAIAITGGMTSSPTDTLDVMAGITPFHLAVERHRLQAALRLAALPPTHPLHNAVRNAANRFVKSHPTPLHFMMHELAQYGVEPEFMEKIAATRQSNKWQAKHTIAIEETKEVAMLVDTVDETEIQVYADGSGIGGMIGAAAVLYRRVEVEEDGNESEIVQRERGTLSYQLGDATCHTVYEGEEVGILLALELIRRETRVRQAAICIDNQAAIRASISIKPTPGHHIMDAIHQLHTLVVKKHRSLKLHIRWVPGHMDITGNEAADEAAREAAAGESSTTVQLPTYLRNPLPDSRTAARQTIRANIDQLAAGVWKRSPRHDRVTKRLTLPDKKVYRSLETLPRKHASLITQIVTGHIPLAAHLFRIRKSESPQCPACHEHEETVDHFIMHCPVHNTPRTQLLRGLNQSQRNITHLLTTKELRTRLLNYVAATGRMRSVYGDIPTLDERAVEDEEEREGHGSEGEDNETEAEAAADEGT